MEYVFKGDSTAKRIARYKTYEAVQQAWWRVGRPAGLAIVLAGYEAAEVGLLRHYLKWPKEKVVFVDIDERCVRLAQQRWPGVRTYVGDIRHLLMGLKEEVVFANLDLMGHFNDEVQETIELLGPRMHRNGILAYTFTAGREAWFKKGLERFADEVEATYDHLKKAKRKSFKMADRRFNGYSTWLRHFIGRQYGELLRVQYGNSPAMGVIVAQSGLSCPKPQIQRVYFREHEDIFASLQARLGRQYAAPLVVEMLNLHTSL